MRILCIDPAYGRRAHAGAALFRDGRLVYAADVKISSGGSIESRIMRTAKSLEINEPWPNDCVDLVVGEWVQTYRGGPPASSLIPLAGVVCATAGLLNADLKFYKPAEWKAQVPREALPDRVRRKLTPTELALCGELGNDGWHAVGLGLFHLGRAKRGVI